MQMLLILLLGADNSGDEGIKNQFEYHNNVLGASKAVRLGKD